jgi:hypothetical protein
MTIVFFLIKVTVGLRASRSMRLKVLDISEQTCQQLCGLYARHFPFTFIRTAAIAPAVKADIDKAYCLHEEERLSSDAKLPRFKYSLMKRNSKALDCTGQIGVTGMTVSHV